MAATQRTLALLLVVALVGIAVLGWTQPRVTADEIAIEEEIKDGMFVHVSSLDAHRALMGLKMANLMADEHEVLVYLDVKAAVLGTKGEEGDGSAATHPAFERSDVLIRQILAKGGVVCVCPTCLQAAGREEADLLDGVKLADKDEFFSFTKGRILSIDY